MSSDEHGIAMYHLAGNWCEECGRAKVYRMLDMTTGCKTCDEVITRHRCTGRPDIDTLAVAESWACPQCGSTWTVAEEEEACPDCCGACGHMVTVRRWDLVPGDHLDSAPKYEPRGFVPFRNSLPRPRTTRPGPFGSCHRTASGIMVHVKPGCRC